MNNTFNVDIISKAVYSYFDIIRKISDIKLQRLT